jgi:F-type H+-transporting ATPase subunit epsilon
MKLRITTPLTEVVDEEQVVSLRAEDASGSFGIQPGHADFLTRLTIGVVSWTGAAGGRRYCAVRRGVLTVLDGQTITVATSEAVVGEDLATLDQQVLRRFRIDLETQRVENVAAARMQLMAVRKLVQQLRPHGLGRPGHFT